MLLFFVTLSVPRRTGKYRLGSRCIFVFLLVLLLNAMMNISPLLTLFFDVGGFYWFAGTGKLSAICVSASATLAIALMSYGWEPLKDNVSYFYGTESNLSDYR